MKTLSELLGLPPNTFFMIQDNPRFTISPFVEIERPSNDNSFMVEGENE